MEVFQRPAKARPDISLDNSGAFVIRGGPDANFGKTGSGNLIGEIGGTSDSTTKFRQSETIKTPSIYTSEKEMSADTKFILGLVGQAEGYNDNLPYHGTVGEFAKQIPAGKLEEGVSYFNSNSYSAGILKGAGVGDVPNPWLYQPGIDKPIQEVAK